MNFRDCRICRTKNNLKYTPTKLEKLHRQRSGRRSEKAQQLLDSAVTVGNICYNCEEQLLNFHQLDDDDDDETIDISSNDGVVYGDGSNSKLPSRLRHEEMPVIVDDDDLLYNIFMKKVCEKRQRAAFVHSQAKSTSAETAIQAQKCSTNYELTQHSLESDGDTEVIEVLTSRETTPIPRTSEYDIKQQTAKLVINLQRIENPKAVSKHTQDSRNNSPPPVKRQKTCNTNEFRLVASLSLLSSDSENETIDCTAKNVSPSTKSKETSIMTSSGGMPTATVAQATSRRQGKIGQHEANASTHHCPVCRLAFASDHQLIHHLRAKHRAYTGKDLREQARHLTDSAMTIRLRYRLRFTYYECQLCGRIDNILRDHKLHIMETHAAESRSLRDPMLIAALKCPICKVKCGDEYTLLCQHMLRAHKAHECKRYLHEIHKLNDVDWAGKKRTQKQVLETARIFQYATRKTYFFECRVCQNIVAGYENHKQHLHSHNIDIDKGGGTAVLRQQLLQQRKKTAEFPKSQRRSQKMTGKTMPPQTTPANVQKPLAVKPKRAAKRACAQPAAVRSHKLPPLEPTHQLPAQIYTCQACDEVFQGFRLWNLHHISAHANKIDLRCLYNTLQSGSLSNGGPTNSHVQQLDSICRSAPSKRTRKGYKPAIILDENCNSKLPEACDATSHRLDTSGINQTTAFSCSITTSYATSGSNDSVRLQQVLTQCVFCTGLLETASGLRLHELGHIKHHDMVMIKRCAFKIN